MCGCVCGGGGGRCGCVGVCGRCVWYLLNLPAIVNGRDGVGRGLTAELRGVGCVVGVFGTC